MNPLDPARFGVGRRAGDEQRLSMAAVALVLLLACCAINAAAGPLISMAGLLAAVAIGTVARMPEIALFSIMGLRPFLAMMPRFPIGSQEFGVEGVVTLLLLAGLVLAIPARRSARPLRDPVLACMALFLLLCLFSLARSTDPLFGARQWLRYAGYLVFFWLAYTSESEEAWTLLSRTLACMAAGLLVAGAVQLAHLLQAMPFPDYVNAMLDNSDELLALRLTGYQDYPHSYARLLLVCVCVFVALGKARRAGPAWVEPALAVLGLVAMVLTGVRSVLLATGVALSIILIGQRRLRHLAGLGLAFLALGFGSGVFQARLNEFTDTKRALEWNPLVDRREIWSVVDHAILERPWMGWGLGSIEPYVGGAPSRSATPRDIAAHCDYRKFAFEAGVPAGVLFAMILATLAWRGWRGRGAPGTAGALSLATAGITAGMMIVGSVDALMQDYVSMSVFWTTAGLAMGWRAYGSGTEEGAACQPTA